MTFSLIQKQKIFIGVDRSEIRKKLGDFDGFYFSDMFPACIKKSATNSIGPPKVVVIYHSRDRRGRTSQ